MTDVTSGQIPVPHAGDSQQRLAASIVRQVQHDLPEPESSQELAVSVEAALLNEGRTNEVTLGYLRVAGLAALTVLSLAGYLRPQLVGAESFPLVIPVSALVATLGAAAFLLVLREGRYASWIRRWIPAADALLIAAGVGLLWLHPGLGVAAARPGLAALGAAACLFLTFSGLIRLSHTAQRMATLLAVIDWALLAWVLEIPAVPATAVAAVLVVLGIFGARLTLTMRRIIAFEVARDRLDHMVRAAHSAVNAREEVLRMVVHDLRNPLSTIKMTAEMLIEMPVTDEQRRKHAATVARCTRSMDRLIQDLLDFARMEAGRITVEAVPTDVASLFASVAELMTPLAESNRLTLDVPEGDGLPPVLVDAERITRVFSNLIGNAVKFTPEGGRISVRGRRLGEEVRFAVVDTGPGIPPEKVSAIFESFWQARSGDERGIGIGLAIARHIVDAHGGAIGVESQVGGGSEFWFTVPVAKPAGRPEGGTESAGTGGR